MLITEFIEQLEKYTPKERADGVFSNQQRTSSRSGILKAEAVLLFAKALHRSGINSFRDVFDHFKVANAETEVRLIPGQGSGISFSYFLTLAGHEDEVKPDRMVVRFVTSAGGFDISEEQAKEAVRGAAKILRKEYPHVTARLLDSEIWKYQSKLSKQTRTEERPRTVALGVKNLSGRLTREGVAAVEREFSRGTSTDKISKMFDLTYSAVFYRRRQWEPHSIPHQVAQNPASQSKEENISSGGEKERVGATAMRAGKPRQAEVKSHRIHEEPV